MRPSWNRAIPEGESIVIAKSNFRMAGGWQDGVFVSREGREEGEGERPELGGWLSLERRSPDRRVGEPSEHAGLETGAPN